jgi:hypothetical protein
MAHTPLASVVSALVDQRACPHALSAIKQAWWVQGLRLIRLLRLMKMLRLLRANRMFSRLEARFAIDYSLLQLYSYLAMLIMLMHWLACGWFMLTIVEMNTECVVLEDSRYSNDMHKKWDSDMTPAWGCCYNWLDCYRYAHFMSTNQTQSTARQYAPSTALNRLCVVQSKATN